MLVVGGVGQLYQGDLDLGRLALERLAADDLGNDVLLEDLHYGAVAVAQRLQDLAPEALVLVGAERRGRTPGAVERRRVRPEFVDREAAQAAVREAVTGYVTIDLVVEVAAGLGCLPQRTVSIEVEPLDLGPGDGLSAPVESALPHALALVRSELLRIPVLALADQMRERLGERGDDTPRPLLELVDELGRVDERGSWGVTFTLGDRLRSDIGSSHVCDGIDGVDWAMMWALLEELDRLRRAEATEGT